MFNYTFALYIAEYSVVNSCIKGRIMHIYTTVPFCIWSRNV